MRKAFLFLTIAIAVGCTKSDVQSITGTVVGQGGGTASSYRVRIENADGSGYSFLCTNTFGLPDTMLACHNSIFVTNLPENLRQTGTVIRFSRFKDKGPNAIWSSNYAAHDVEVYNAIKLR